MAINGVEIQVGQLWRTRAGNYVQIVERLLTLSSPWKDRAGQTYWQNGYVEYGMQTDGDLVSLVVPQTDTATQLADLAVFFRAGYRPVPAPAGDSITATTFGPLAANDAGIGDINSDAKGSGARFNTGKVPYDLVPIELMARYWDQVFEGGWADDDDDDDELSVIDSTNFIQALWAVGEFQARRSEACLIDVLLALGDGWEDCARVFDYGQKKYAAWNWSKGMAWSIPLACATRHLIAMLNGEEIDIDKMVDGVLVEGSNLPHRGHVYCNICMLLTYEETFIEGDDRPVDGALADNETYL